MLRVDTRGGAVRVAVHVQPRASRSEIVGLHGAALKVRLQAPPVDGAANDALIALLAERLGVPRRAVRVVAGAASRAKTVEIDGTTEVAVRALLTHRATPGGEPR
ncbi:MAG TPA: DUF167 domain-containing protein [Gemmatimonadaceae bacterium]|nr:DUF167 domain-containing protein [Gemmatimonadaceae bacterium]